MFVDQVLVCVCVCVVPGPRTLSVLGRDVTLLKTCGSIADCTFSELCGKVSSDVFLFSVTLKSFNCRFKQSTTGSTGGFQPF